MSKKQKAISILLTFIALSAIVFMILVVSSSDSEIEYGEFVPPKFDENSVTGEPDVPENSGYSLMNISDEYNIYVCGKLKLKDDNVDVYFTSDFNNSVWTKLQVLDNSNNIIGETGVIKPGEYVKSVTLNSEIQKDESVKLKVVGYEPETYHSAGSASMNTTIEVE